MFSLAKQKTKTKTNQKTNQTKSQCFCPGEAQVLVETQTAPFFPAFICQTPLDTLYVILGIVLLFVHHIHCVPDACHVLCPGNEGNKVGSGMVMLQPIKFQLREVI